MNDDEATVRPAVPLAIVGIGALFPEADGHAAYWANVVDKVDAIRDLPESHFRAEDYLDADPKARDRLYSARGGFLDPIEFDPLAYGIAPHDLEAVDTAQLFGLVVADRALRDAGYGQDGRAFDRTRVSVLMGVTGALELVVPLGARLGHPIWRRALAESGVPPEVAADVCARISDSYVEWREQSFPGLLGNVVAGRIANRLDLHGTNTVVDAACASSLSALHLASLELSTGRADMVVTGGIDTFSDVFMYMCFSKTPALSPRGEARPFDADADGTVLGEGLGVCVVKRLADAERDGDRVYAVIKGVGTSSDGRGNAVFAPSSAGQERCLRDAYRQAGVSPATVELLEAHGTGTKVGDAVEVRALTQVFRDARADGTWCALGSVKAQIGHTKAAAGMAGLIKAALALHHKVLPPTIKVTRPNEAVAQGGTPFYVNTAPRPWLGSADHPRRAGVSAFGFGGSNFHCVLEEHAPRRAEVDWDARVEILPFAGADPAALAARLDAWSEPRGWPDLQRGAAALRRAFDAGAPCRIVLVVERDRTDLPRLVANACTLLERLSDDDRHASTPDGAWFGRGPIDGATAFLFPGQGSQQVGMLRDLACRFPSFLDALSEADQVFAADDPEGRRLSDLVYPHPAFDDAARAAQANALTDTRVAQPAIGAVSLGAALVLAEFGVEPQAVAGHSYGELVALCASGRFTAVDLHRLSALRGRLMTEGTDELGSMLAVQDAEDAVRAAVLDESLDLVLANRNAPRQLVLSGRTSEIERAAALFDARGVRAKRLPVAAAFHSPLVAHAQEPMRRALAEVDVQPGRVPVYANSTGGRYPDDPDDMRALLAGQLARSVEFVDQIRALHDDGVRTFVEVGPGSRLTSLVRDILAERPHVGFALDASSGRRRGAYDLAATLARLAALGHAVDLPRWNDGVAPPAPAAGARPRFTVSIDGANYRDPQRNTPRPHVPASAPSPSPAAVDAPPQSVHRPLPESPPVTALPHSAGNPDAVAAALRVTQEHLAALTRLSEQTADLHRRFLEGQEAAHRALAALLSQQQGVLGLTVPTLSGHAPAEAATVLPAPSVAPAPPVAPPVVQVAAPPAAAAEPRRPAVDLVAVLLDVIAEKTGYPTDMLELDMELDADLGIDSIKRVEILSAVQERAPGAREVPSDRMGSLRTLRQVVDFLGAGAPRSAAAPPVVRAAPAPAAPDVAEDLTGIVLAVIAEKTGYPTDMLELDMELDADLGIDSIKRVEILSTVQERAPGAREVPSDRMGALRTLRQVVDFLGGAAASPAVTASPDWVGMLLAVVAEKTGYPVDMLELDMELDADLGIDSIKRVEILSTLQELLPGAREVPSERMGALRTLRQVVEFVSGSAADSAAPRETAAPAVPAPVAAARVSPLNRSVLDVSRLDAEGRRRVALAPGARVWVAGDEDALTRAVAATLTDGGYAIDVVPVRPGVATAAPADLAGLVVVAPATGADDAFLRGALGVLRAASPVLGDASATAARLFATVSRLDGAFGLIDLNGTSDPTSAGLAGFAKTAAHEWPHVACKALDVRAGIDAADAAHALVDELFLAGPIEVGVQADRRVALALESAPLGPASSGAPRIAAGDLVVVTGGARGVTAEVARALGAAFRPTLLLLGRSPEPDADPVWLDGVTDAAAVKRALRAHDPECDTPRALESAFRRVTAAREIRDNLDRVAATGARVIYRSVDVRDAAAVAAVLDQVRAETGRPVSGVVHGAGVLADARIEDKTPEQFDRVYGTKVDGLRALLSATEHDPLSLLVLFSSSTGRFGRTGQADYAAANEVLNKAAWREARRRPECRVVSVNWGPWDGGMVTPALRSLFASEGVGLIGLEQGAAYLIDELRAEAPSPAEVVILAEGSAPAPRGDVAYGTAFERELDVTTHPALADHVIGGRAVLPLALLVEWLAHGALHGNPGRRFTGVEDLRVLAGVKLDAGASSHIRVCAASGRETAVGFVVPVELRGEGGRLHARARIVLDGKSDSAAPRLAPVAGTHTAPSLTEAYASQLFHGKAFEALASVDAIAADAVAVTAHASPTPRTWFTRPLRGSWLADPLALDAAFQALILWARAERGMPCLPCAVGRLTLTGRRFPGDGVRVTLTVRPAGPALAVADVEFTDAAGALVARMDGVECVLDAALDTSFRQRTLSPLGAS